MIKLSPILTAIIACGILAGQGCRTVGDDPSRIIDKFSPPTIGKFSGSVEEFTNLYGERTKWSIIKNSCWIETQLLSIDSLSPARPHGIYRVYVSENVRVILREGMFFEGEDFGFFMLYTGGSDGTPYFVGTVPGSEYSGGVEFDLNSQIIWWTAYCHSTERRLSASYDIDRGISAHPIERIESEPMTTTLNFSKAGEIFDASVRISSDEFYDLEWNESTQSYDSLKYRYGDPWIGSRLIDGERHIYRDGTLIKMPEIEGSNGQDTQPPPK